MPVEWTVSNYSIAPEYLKAGALVVKTYAWYHIVHQQHNYPPAYADIVDSTDAQRFVAGSYDAMLQVYKDYADAAIAEVSNTVIVKTNASAGEDDIILAEYRTNSGYDGCGYINQEEALFLARYQGYTYKQIIKHYYDYSVVTGYGEAYFRTHF